MVRLRSSLLLRILLLVVLATLPAFVLIVYNAIEQREAIRREARDGALRLARLANSNEARLIDASRQLLVTLAQLPPLRNIEIDTANRFLASALGDYPNYRNLGIADDKGNLVASAQPISALVYVGDRTWYQRAVATHDFAVGDYQIGRISHVETLNFAYPLLKKDNSLRGVIFASMDLSVLGKVAAEAHLPAGTVITVIDRNGVVLARSEDASLYVGRAYEVAALSGRSSGGEGIAELSGPDHVNRIYAVTQLHIEAQPSLYVAAGIPTELAYAEANRTLRRNVLVILLVAGLALGAAWAFAHFFVVRRARALLQLTRRLSSGDLSARASGIGGEDELAQLARAFDEMAAALQAREAQARAAAEERAALLTREQHARAEAETANRAKDAFLATLSHELRTPLTAMYGWVRLLRKGRRDDETLERGLDIIERNARAQTQLIESMLDVSRIVAGKFHLEAHDVDLKPVVEAVVGVVRPAAEAKHITLDTQLNSVAGCVRGDADRLHQIVWNLLSNAIKFTPDNGAVRITLARVDHYVKLQIHDTGIGIPPEAIPHVFERFWQADSTSTRVFGGLGLGLALVRHLIELHGGTIQVASAGIDRGTEFTVTLPVSSIPKKDQPVSKNGTASLPELEAWQANLNGLRVLIVEDDVDSLELLTEVLRLRGAQVTAVHSAAEALKSMDVSQPDVLVSDIGMPGEDGYTLIRKVRLRNGHLPALALTAYAKPEDRERALSAGFQKHVAKPVEPDELVAAVANLAGKNGMN